MYRGGGGSGGYRGPTPDLRKCRDCGSFGWSQSNNPWKLSLSNIIGWVFGAGAIFLLLVAIWTFTQTVAGGVLMVIVAAVVGAISIPFLFFLGASYHCRDCGSTRAPREERPSGGRYG